MNNLGQTNDNLHVGNVLITEDLDVDGDLTVDGSLVFNTIEGKEICVAGQYCLPTSTGTLPNQVITLNPDLKTTEFKTVSIPTLVDQRIATSRWFTQQQSLLNFSAYTGIFLNSNTGNSTTVGDSIIPASDLTLSEENYSVLHVQFILRINTTDIAQPNQWQCRLRLNDGVGQGTIEWEVQEFSGTLQTNIDRIQDFYLTFIRNPADPTKINVSNQSIKHTNAISSTPPTTSNTDKLFLSNNQFKLGSETGEISMLLPTTKSYFCQFNNYADGRPLTITMACQRPNPNAANTIDYGVLMGELYTFKKQTLPSGGPVVNDHLLLSNLNGGTGDGGHINLYDRRGVKPMTGDMNMNNFSLLNGLGLNTQFLSASAQIDTTLLVGSGGGPLAVSSNDLTLTETNIPGDEYLNINNTRIQSFKTLDMNSKEIQNVPVISNSGAPLVLTETTNSNAIILNRDASNGIYLECVNPAQNINLSAGGGTNSFQVRPTDVLMGSFLDMATNDITNANVLVRASNGNVINFDNDVFPPLITGALTIESGTGKEINVTADNVLRLAGNNINHNAGNTTGVHQFSNSGGLQAQFTNVNIELFKPLDMKNNNISSVAALTATQVNTDTIENSGSGFLTFTNLGSYTPSFTPSALDMNLGNINNVDTIENTGSANITLPVVIGTPSGALQVKNGGAYIKQDLQVDGAIYCDNINNIKPSGGLYSESSGFNIASTNLTETNLLGQGGSAGSLSIPADGFTQYDSYSFKASGVLSGGSNDTATLRLKSLVNGTTPVELGSIVIQLSDNGLVDVAWKVEADFNVRTLGAAGVGVLVLSGNFAYTNNNDVVKTYLRTIVNSTVFDTTQSNELQFTYQNDAVNPLTNIRIEQASFTKWF